MLTCVLGSILGTKRIRMSIDECLIELGLEQPATMPIYRLYIRNGKLLESWVGVISLTSWAFGSAILI